MKASVCLATAVLLSAVGSTLAANDSQDRATTSVDLAGGLVVHLYCGDGRGTAALHTSDRVVVQGLDADVTAARQYIQSRDLYGKVSVAQWAGKRLPYVDNLVNVVVADELGELPMDEVMRVLAPEGVALIGGRKSVKPRPETIDDWPQHHHGADNNAVARDTVVGPPRHFQWINEPEWSRSHLGMASITSLISAGGRLFSIEDRGSVENPALPGEVFLICRDAFNGIELWRHPFPDWHPANIFIKLTPSQLQRQLAAIGDRVYCTPGLNAPITVFDATTGKVLKQYAGTELTQEFVFDRGLLIAAIGDPVDTSSIGGGRYTLGETGFPPEVYGPILQHRDDPQVAIVAIDAASGEEQWRLSAAATQGYQGASLASRGASVVYATNDAIVCLDRTSGEQRWRTPLQKPGPRAGSGRNGDDYLRPNARRNSVTLVLSDQAVFLASQNVLTAFGMRDGSPLWTAQTQMNHHKPPDVFLTAGAVWTANNIGYDPLTGERIRLLPQQMKGPMGHDRCYQNRITDRWYLNTVTGGTDFLALDGSGEFPHPWGRSTCGVGHLPCNGLLYLGPPACSCGNKVQLNQFNALAAEPSVKSSGQLLDIAIDPRVEKGPAYDFAFDSRSSTLRSSSDWPTYRGEASRSGHTTAAVPPELKPRWQTKLTTRASAPIVVADRVFVADVDAHTVCALHAETGELQWAFTAEGRVDSPPTWHAGRLLFGSRDGWVYCLRAADGALAWRCKALPDRAICALEQIESAWPVCGSVLLHDGVAYCVAGRNSYLDGGLFLFGLDPKTGQVLHQRSLYGPYDEQGHPAVSEETAWGGTGAGGIQGNKGDILLASGDHLFLRHDAFTPDLTPLGSDADLPPHLITSHGFTERISHHRSFWTFDTNLYYDRWTSQMGAQGDILVTDGMRYYEVRGYPPGRYTTYDVRAHAYTLFAGEMSAKTPPKNQHREFKERWQSKIPLTGKAMALAGDVVFVAGTPAEFPKRDLAAAYEGRRGGVLWAASAEDGAKLAEYKLDASPEWDSMAAAGGRLYLCTTDGRVHCFAPNDAGSE